jgi:hypothetical protein
MMALDDPNPEVETGPTWARPTWRTDTDDLTAALDPTQMAVVIKATAAKAGVAVSEADLQRAASDAIKAMLIIRTYRVRGHLAANLDPLGLSKRELPADLDRVVVVEQAPAGVGVARREDTRAGEFTAHGHGRDLGLAVGREADP